MGHYKSNLRDIEFNLFEVFQRQDLLGSGPYPDLDEETARDILSEVEKLALGPLADSFAEGDRNPPVFDPATGSVTMPEGTKRSYHALHDAEWYRLSLLPELGGTGAPRTLAWSVAELILGANPAVWMYSGGPSFANVLQKIGTPEQQHFAQLAVDRGWGATMVLTEPDAGSDVGRARSDREHLPPGAGPARGPRARHQGTVDVPGAQVHGR
jgi:alkylation response protein AidB-like acyl-CoA dehydrogenase